MTGRPRQGSGGFSVYAPVHIKGEDRGGRRASRSVLRPPALRARTAARPRHQPRLLPRPRAAWFTASPSPLNFLSVAW